MCFDLLFIDRTEATAIKNLIDVLLCAYLLDVILSFILAYKTWSIALSVNSLEGFFLSLRLIAPGLEGWSYS